MKKYNLIKLYRMQKSPGQIYPGDDTFERKICADCLIMPAQYRRLKFTAVRRTDMSGPAAVQGYNLSRHVERSLKEQ